MNRGPAQERRPARQRPGEVAGRAAPHRRHQRPRVRGLRGAGAPGACRWPAHRRAQAARPRGRHPGHLRQRQLRPLAVRLPQGRRALPRRRRARRARSRACSQPDEDDYFVLKPKHSAFYATTLDTLLTYLGAQHAHPDRHRRQHLRPLQRQRRLHARLPPGRAGGLRRLEHGRGERPRAGAESRQVLKADITESPRLDLEALVRQPSAASRQSNEAWPVMIEPFDARRLLRRGRLPAADDAGPRRAVHRDAQRRAGTPRRADVGAGHLHRARSRTWRRRRSGISALLDDVDPRAFDVAALPRGRRT